MNEKKYDVTALGELLIDFTQNGFSSQGNFLFEANPGGAPCNVLAMLAKSGKKTAFIGKVGDDFLGRHLRDVVSSLGIDTDYLLFDTKVHTTLAFVHNSDDGDRDFSFYRNPGADMMLKKEEIPLSILKNTKIFHFGSLSMTGKEVREATRFAVSVAKEAGSLISFDPNLREPLWDDLKDAKEQIEWGISVCDFLKISDNEILWVTGSDNFDDAVLALQNRYHVPMLALSKGKEGSAFYYNDKKVSCAPFLSDKTIETTGAGDTFCACMLKGILESYKEDKLFLTEEGIYELLRFANAAASIITTRKGALKVMPEAEEVRRLLG